MSASRKAGRTKTARVPPEPRPWWRWRPLVTAAAILGALVIVSGALLVSPVARPLRDLATGGSADAPRAAIVDQLSLTAPGPAFVEAATRILERAGYAVDYYPGEDVTVDFYRNLPAHDYDLIILRAHTARLLDHGVTTDDVSLFTSQPHTLMSEAEELKEGGPLRIVTYYRGSDEFFGVPPAFIESSVKGRFDGSIIVLMGCDGLRSDATAAAFLRKGASAVVGWSEFVSAAATDAATERLLDHLLADRLAVTDAVARTAAEVGPDPAFGAELRVLAAVPGGAEGD